MAGAKTKSKLVLDALAGGKMTAAELADAVGMTTREASSIVQHLIARGEARRAGKVQRQITQELVVFEAITEPKPSQAAA